MTNLTAIAILSAKKTTIISGIVFALSLVATQIDSAPPEFNAIIYLIMGMAMGIFFIGLGVLLGNSFEEDWSMTSLSKETLSSENELRREIQKRQFSLQDIEKGIKPLSSNGMKSYTGMNKPSPSSPLLSPIIAKKQKRSKKAV